MTAIITQGDALALPLPDESVDLIVTSPPYFGLRSYTDGGEHYDGQVGDEPTPREYVDALIACTREWMRVLKPGGSIFVNLGDKYSGYMNRPDREHKEVPEGSISRGQWLASQIKAPGIRYVKSAPEAFGIPYKSLMLLPERYRVRCVDELGLIARAVIVWDKPNGLPENVSDRVRRQHEDWVHLTKATTYYAAIDELREAHTMTPQRRPAGRPADTTPRQGQPRQSWSTATRDEVGVDGNPLGKIPGSVWRIATQPLKVPEQLGIDHFAAFPMEWPRRLIRGWCPREVCTACGQGRRPVTSRNLADRSRERTPVGAEGRTRRLGATSALSSSAHAGEYPAAWISGYRCGCPDTTAPTTPGVVLDPFGGTGTTALVADVLGRVGISNDLSLDYCRLARWRTADPKQRARAGEVKPRPARKRPARQPAPVPDNVLSLFDAEEWTA